MTSTRGDNYTNTQKNLDDDELIGEEIRPAPMCFSDGKIPLVQIIGQDHTYAVIMPEHTKITQSFNDNIVATLSSSNIQSAGLNYNYKPSK